MRYEDFLHGGEPVEEPVSHYFSYVSMAADSEGRAAVIGWKVNQYLSPALVLCDFRTGFFSDPIFADYSDYLSLCYSQCGMAKTCALVPIYYRPSEKDVIKTYEFAPKVSALVAAGKVRLSKDAHERSRSAPLGSALDFRIEKLSDPLAAASVAGICPGLLGTPSELRCARKDFYNSRPWRKLRYEILKKYGGRCQCCGRGASDGVVICVDHILPIKTHWHLRLDPENLPCLCADDNLAKASTDTTDWR